MDSSAGSLHRILGTRSGRGKGGGIQCARFSGHAGGGERARSHPAGKLARNEVADHGHAGLRIVETGNGREIPPAMAAEDVGILDRDLFQRLQAVGGEARRDDGEVLHTTARQRLDRLVGIGLQPFGASEARLEGHAQPVLIVAERLAQQPRGLGAMAVIGIALVEIVARDAVERDEDDVGRERQLRERVLQRGRDRSDIDRIVVIGRRDAQRRLPAHGHELAEGLVAHGRRRRRRVLWIERHQQEPLAALFGERGDARANRGIAVAHRPVDDDARAAERRGELFGLRARDGLERGFVPLAIPDRVIVAALGARTRGQDDAVEHELPEERIVLDHARVGQELPQVAAHRPEIGRVRRSEIDEQHADPSRPHRRMILGPVLRARPREKVALSHAVRTL